MSVEIDFVKAEYRDKSPSYLMIPPDRSKLDIYLKNVGTDPARSTGAVLSSKDPELEVTDPKGGYWRLDPGETAKGVFEVRLKEPKKALYELDLSVEYESGGQAVTKELKVSILVFPHPVGEKVVLADSSQVDGIAAELKQYWDEFGKVYSFAKEIFDKSDRLINQVLVEGWGSTRKGYGELVSLCEGKVSEILNYWLMGNRIIRKIKDSGLEFDDTMMAKVMEALFKAKGSHGLGGIVYRPDEWKFLSGGYQRLFDEQKERLISLAKSFGIEELNRFLYEYLHVIEASTNLYLFGELCLGIWEGRFSGEELTERKLELYQKDLEENRRWVRETLEDLYNAIKAGNWNGAYYLADQLYNRCEHFARAMPPKIAILNHYKRTQRSTEHVDLELGLCTAMREFGRYRAIGLYYKIISAAGINGDAEIIQDEIEAASKLPFDRTDERERVSVDHLLEHLDEYDGKEVWVKGSVTGVNSQVRKRGNAYMHFTLFQLKDRPVARTINAYSHGHFMADNGLRDGCYFEGAVKVEKASEVTGAPLLRVVHIKLGERKEESWLWHARWAVRNWWDDFFSRKEASCTYENERRDLVRENPKYWEVQTVDYGEINAQADIFLGPPDAIRVFSQWNNECRDMFYVLSMVKEAFDRTIQGFDVMGSEAEKAGKGEVEDFVGPRRVAMAALAKKLEDLRRSVASIYFASNRDLANNTQSFIDEMAVEELFPVI